MENKYNINIDDNSLIKSYGDIEIDRTFKALSKLKEESKTSKHFDELTLTEFDNSELILKSLLENGKNNLFIYLINSVLSIDEFSKEELISLKNKAGLFYSKLNCLEEAIESVNEEMWDMLGSFSKHWRIK